MKIIKRKSITFALAICLMILGFALLATQVSQPTVAHAHEFSGIGFTEHDSASALETIATIEEELQEQGTSVLEVLYNQRDFYLSGMRTKKCKIIEDDGKLYFESLQDEYFKYEVIYDETHEKCR